MSLSADKAAGAGENLYWKYESYLKKLDSDFYSVVGAAGELFSIRTGLYEYVGDQVLLDDLIISLKICMKKYRIVYEPRAYAMEEPSQSIKEEQKRKIRISAGAFQSIGILKGLLNPFKYPKLSFQYISHRLLRWTACPILLPVIFILNCILVVQNAGPLYEILLVAQIIFYLISFAGWIYSRKNIKLKALYVPYYFVFLNLSLYLGFFRFIKGKQSVLWDKAERRRNFEVIQKNKIL
jgi:cellulose synthase/poly-beta-1,6-N-acetylglucosamine synthase-like glycosyltransferase